MSVRSDAKTMFDLCSDTESAKTIKALREDVDSLCAHLRTGGQRRKHAASENRCCKTAQEGGERVYVDMFTDTVLPMWIIVVHLLSLCP